MPYFSLKMKKDSRPVAKIDGGLNHGQIIYLVENDDEIEHKIKLDGKAMYKFVKNDLEDLINGKRKEIILTDGKLIPIPRFDKRDSFFIAGPEGSGKSFLCSMIIKQYKKMFKKNPFFLFSKVMEDDALDALEPNRIELNDELLHDPIEVHEMEDSIILFDDIDTIHDKKLLEELRRIRDSVLEIGRHKNCYILSTAHNMTNSKATKMSLLESANVGFFPKMGDSYHINRYLKEYGGLSKDQIKKIYSLPSRWVIHHKRAPNYIMYEKGIYLL